MAAFDLHERVTVKNNGQRIRGRVTSRSGRHYNVLTDDKRLLRGIFSSQLRALQTEYALIMEGNLDPGLSAYDASRQRRTAQFIAEFLRTLGYTPLVEKIHSRESLKHFIRSVGKKATYIHISSHGLHAAAFGQALFLTHDEVALPFEMVKGSPSGILRKFTPSGVRIIQDDFKFLNDTFNDALLGKVLVLSACDLGRKNGIAQYLSTISGASAVVSYSGQVSDDDVMLAEALLYRRLEDCTKKVRPGNVVISVNVALQKLGIRVPLVAWCSGRPFA